MDLKCSVQLAPFLAHHWRAYHSVEDPFEFLDTIQILVCTTHTKYTVPEQLQRFNPQHPVLVLTFQKDWLYNTTSPWSRHVHRVWGTFRGPKVLVCLNDEVNGWRRQPVRMTTRTTLMTLASRPSSMTSWSVKKFKRDRGRVFDEFYTQGVHLQDIVDDIVVTMRRRIVSRHTLQQLRRLERGLPADPPPEEPEMEPRGRQVMWRRVMSFFLCRI